MDGQLLEILENIKNRESVIFDNELFNRGNIKKHFYPLTEEAKQEGIEHFFLNDYRVVWGDFVLGIKYSIDSKNYYMLVSANSRHAPFQQIAIGMEDGEQVYMIIESIPISGELGFISFPKSSINKDTKGFVPRCYRDKIGLSKSMNIILNNETKKCLRKGLESSQTFSQVITKLEKNKEKENKRKKLKI